MDPTRQDRDTVLSHEHRQLLPGLQESVQPLRHEHNPESWVQVHLTLLPSQSLLTFFPETPYVILAPSASLFAPSANFIPFLTSLQRVV